MITIYGLQSPYVYRVRACLLQKGLGFQHVSVNLANRSEEFRKLSPIGTIPVLEDEDGTAVCDSFHIGLYLDEKYPNTHKMFGHSLKEKVKVFNAMGVIDRIHTVLGPFNAEKYGYAERFRKTNLTHRALLYDVQQKEDALADLSRRLEAPQWLSFFARWKTWGLILALGRSGAAISWAIQRLPRCSRRRMKKA